MFIDVPKGKTNEELYQWCIELCEKINRELCGIGDNSNKESE